MKSTWTYPLRRWKTINYIVTCNWLFLDIWFMKASQKSQISLVISNWSESALDLVRDFFLPNPIHPQWMSLHGCHNPKPMPGYKEKFEIQCPFQAYIAWNYSTWRETSHQIYNFKFIEWMNYSRIWRIWVKRGGVRFGWMNNMNFIR